jgi:N-hydroxyarylamine O-acetyltransferase
VTSSLLGAPVADPHWRTDGFDLTAYLARIGYDGPREATVETLTGVHRAHVTTFPFENIDLVLGDTPKLDLPSVQAKLVGAGRGGGCGEQNVLLAAALQHLGLPVTRLVARQLIGSSVPLPKVHTALLVRAGERRWLADAGFGGEGLIEPLEFVDGAEHAVGGWRWRLDHVRGGDGTGAEAAEGDRWVLRTMHGSGWFDLYAFTPEPQFPADYDLGNHYIATSPTSKLTAFLMVQRVRPDIKQFLLGRIMVVMPAGAPTERQDLEPGEVAGVLRDVFGIALDDELAQRVADLRPLGLLAGP